MTFLVLLYLASVFCVIMVNRMFIRIKGPHQQMPAALIFIPILNTAMGLIGCVVLIWIIFFEDLGFFRWATGQDLINKHNKND